MRQSERGGERVVIRPPPASYRGLIIRCCDNVDIFIIPYTVVRGVAPVECSSLVGDDDPDAIEGNL